MRTFCIISALILTCLSVYSQKQGSISLIDSVSIKVDGKEFINTPARIYYKDSLIVFKNDSINILLLNKTKLQLLINDSIIPGATEAKVRKERITSIFKHDNDTYIKVGINKNFTEKKQIGWILPALVGLLVGLGIFGKQFGNSKNKRKSTEPIRSDGAEIINNLNKLDYYKYLSDKSKYSELKDLMIDTINDSNVLVTIDNDDSLSPIDNRLFFCDGETLFEVDGITEYLTLIKPAFDCRNLSLKWGDEISNQNDNYWSHKISVNNKEYIAFEGNMDNMLLWGIAQLRFYEMINDLLIRQDSNEQVYPISGGEDGQFIFLTKEQFDYIASLDLDEEFKPRTVSDWKKHNDLE